MLLCYQQITWWLIASTCFHLLFKGFAVWTESFLLSVLLQLFSLVGKECRLRAHSVTTVFKKRPNSRGCAICMISHPLVCFSPPSILLSVHSVIASERMVTNPIRSIWGSYQISLIHCNTGVKRTSGQYQTPELWQNYESLNKRLVRLKWTCIRYTWGEET